jgi:hypothetical protein
MLLGIPFSRNPAGMKLGWGVHEVLLEKIKYTGNSLGKYPLGKPSRNSVYTRVPTEEKQSP